MLSPEGRCKALDAAADGYVRAEACGALLLSTHSPALPAAAGRRLVGAVSGAAVNQDGRSSSLTAPNGPAQAEVLLAALRDAGLGPPQMTAISGHLTATPLGDPIGKQGGQKQTKKQGAIASLGEWKCSFSQPC